MLPPLEDLGARLMRRRPDIEQALLIRATSISGSDAVEDPECLLGLRTAVASAIDYSIRLIATETEPPPIPDSMVVQARLAARHSVGLDTVVRRYIAGTNVLADFILEEVDLANWRSIRRLVASALDLLVAKVTAEYEAERIRRSESREARRLGIVEQLLNAEPVDAGRLEYDLDLHHIGLVAKGSDCEAPIRQLVSHLGGRLLLVRPDRGTAWAWLGLRHEIDRTHLETAVDLIQTTRSRLALGDLQSGESGWRQSHRQARAALPVAFQQGRSAVHYIDVCVVASALRDDILISTLRSNFLAPLEQERDGGDKFRATLRAYFSAGRNAASTAAALGISRQAVATRLRAVEHRIGRTLDSCSTEIELALNLP